MTIFLLLAYFLAGVFYAILYLVWVELKGGGLDDVNDSGMAILWVFLWPLLFIVCLFICLGGGLVYIVKSCIRVRRGGIRGTPTKHE